MFVSWIIFYILLVFTYFIGYITLYLACTLNYVIFHVMY
uniref:Uncharacterized protein n=1 Tax=Anguilla anguilla TaxID=7936 RepID=A0A0E9XW80_ANGAN